MMVSSDLVVELAFLGADLVVFGLVCRCYIRKDANLKALKNAPELSISSLHNDLAKCDGQTIPYAAVRGVVKASPPLRSTNAPGKTGAIHEIIYKEHKVEWSPAARIWLDTKKPISYILESTPFVLASPSFWENARVEVLEPLKASSLPLTTVYDHFVPYDSGFSSMVMGWVRGERTKGIQYVENMLVEGTMLTGVGELVMEGNVAKLQPPSGSNLEYHLTMLTPEELSKQLQGNVRLWRILAVVCGCFTAYFIVWLARRWHRRRSCSSFHNDSHRHDERARQESRRQQRDMRGNERYPTCVSCLTNPVEMLFLECGHACVCIDCAQIITDFCPLCRSPITRTVEAYLP